MSRGLVLVDMKNEEREWLSGDSHQYLSYEPLDDHQMRVILPARYTGMPWEHRWALRAGVTFVSLGASCAIYSVVEPMGYTFAAIVAALSFQTMVWDMFGGWWAIGSKADAYHDLLGGDHEGL